MIRVYKHNAEGVEVLSYTGVVLARDEHSILIRAVFQRDSVNVEEVVTFNRGDIFYEWFYSNEWYSVFRVEDSNTGALKGWYCNLSRPATITTTTIRTDDLALDLFVDPQHQIYRLDQDDFDQLSLSDFEITQVYHAVDKLEKAVLRRIPPFNA